MEARHGHRQGFTPAELLLLFFQCDIHAHTRTQAPPLRLCITKAMHGAQGQGYRCYRCHLSWKVAERNSAKIGLFVTLLKTASV